MELRTVTIAARRARRWPPRSGCRAPGRRQSGPSRITRTRSATRRISGSSEETTIIERALGGELLDQGVDLGLGADVDAAGRLVEQQDARTGGDPAADDRLLLVAARELADRPLDREGPEVQSRISFSLSAASARWRTKPSREKRRMDGSADIAAHRAARDDAVALALLRQQAEAGGDRGARAAERRGGGLRRGSRPPRAGRRRRSGAAAPCVPRRPGPRCRAPRPCEA